MSNKNKIALGAIAALLVVGLIGKFLPLAIFASVVIVLFMWADANKQARDNYYRDLQRWYEQNPQVLGPYPQPATTPPPAPPRRNAWSIAGTTIAVIAGIGGVAIVAGMILLVIALGSHPNLFPNK
jgi:hypothetical protein